MLEGAAIHREHPPGAAARHVSKLSPVTCVRALWTRAKRAGEPPLPFHSRPLSFTLPWPQQAAPAQSMPLAIAAGLADHVSEGPGQPSRSPSSADPGRLLPMLRVLGSTPIYPARAKPPLGQWAAASFLRGPDRSSSSWATQRS